ncbi:PREDICTED: cyclic GMP-AMP synthase isoform X1 [Gekko japonicus]|uniref:Cyclic GMP-AMP synthase isoform X1 n=1 Tax=Gekko japonicus TaxID=146911 RepID=A0ABM1L7C9_GEKJA|nr:PREDICTED: cyclic GMP-AMP synthase isoform X1 [Gekko japonicus]
MDRKPAEKGQGARKAIAAVQPAPEDDAAKPAAASKGRGRGQEPSSDCPGKAKTSLVNQGKGSGHSGKESAPRGRKTSLENSTPGAEKCDRPAGKSDNPPGDEGALQKRERHLQAKAFEPEKADVASGAVSREKNRLPDGEKKEAPHRGKKASQKARPPPAKEPPEQGRAEAVPRGPPPPQGISLRQVLERLTLRRVEISDASRRVNSVRDLLVEAIRKRLYLSSNSVQIVGTGSYYEHLKITKPDEFDIMLKVPGVRVELEPYNGGDCKGVYYFVKLKRNPGLQRLNDFVDDQQYLSASKFLSELRSIIINEVKTINGMKVTVERKKPGSPAVTLRIGEPPSHVSVDIILALEMPSTTLGSIRKGGPDIKKWLGLKQQNELDDMELCLVPKNAKDGAHFTDTWRLSFSLAEKTIIQYHGQTKTCCESNGSKCCRKDCLKLLKYLLEQLKTKHQSRNQFSKFCSYHAKTAFFHACTKWTSDEEWLPINVEECFGRLLDYFLDCLTKAELKHFFIPECNLICTDSKCKILKNVIESERTAKFPIFQQI